MVEKSILDFIGEKPSRMKDTIVDESIQDEDSKPVNFMYWGQNFRFLSRHLKIKTTGIKYSSPGFGGGK